MLRSCLLLLFVSSFAGLPAAAQTDLPPVAQPSPSQEPAIQPNPSQQPARQPQKLLDRFKAANTSHDGRLTLQQAKTAHMRWVVRHFAAIDAQRKGYITVRDIRAYRRQMQTPKLENVPS